MIRSVALASTGCRRGGLAGDAAYNQGRGQHRRAPTHGKSSAHRLPPHHRVSLLRIIIA